MSVDFVLRPHKVMLHGFSGPSEYNWLSEVRWLNRHWPQWWKKNRQRFREENLDVKLELEFEVLGSQEVSGYPWLAERLVSDFQGWLRYIGCSEGDFYKLLLAGKEDLGHVIDHVFMMVYDSVLHEIGRRSDQQLHAVALRFYISQSENSATYQVNVYQSKDIRYDFTHEVAYVVFSYLNSILQGKDYDIRERLRRLIEDYTPQPEPVPQPEKCQLCPV